MRVVVCIVVASVFVSSIKADQPKLDLPLDAVLKFDEKNQPRDLAIIDQVQDVLQKIKDTMRRRSGRRRDTDLSFAEFVVEAAKILRDYNDNDLEDLYAVIDDEARRFILKENSLQDIFGNNFRRYLFNQLDTFKDVPAETLRRHLDTAIDVLENNDQPREINQIIDLGNTLYNGAGDKLKSVLENLEKARRSNGDILGDILRSTLRSLVSDHYANMNFEVKDGLFEMAKRFWDAFSSKTSSEQQSTLTQRTTVKNERQKEYAYNYNFHLTTRSKIPTRSSSVHWNYNSYKSGHHNRYIKLGPKYTTIPKKKQEIFLSHYELKKLTNTTDLDEARHEKNHPSRSDAKYSSSKLKKRPHLKYKSERIETRGKGHKILRGDIDTKDDSDSRDSQLLTGGRAVQDIHFRAELSEDANSPDQTEEARGNKEYSDHLRTSKDSEYSSSVERSRTEDSRNKEEEDISGSEKTPGFRASIEGLIIESFENDDNVERKVIRKSNVNDTLLPDVNPNAPENVKKLIENIEKEIEDVKEQIEYVKHLKESDMVEQQKFKTADSSVNSSKLSASSSPPNNNPNSDSMERYNAFLSADSIERVTSGVAFRAHDDPNDNKYSTEIENTENITKTIVAENTTETTVTTNTSTINKTVEDHAVEIASVDAKDNILTSDNKNKEKVYTVGDNEVDKPNDVNTVTDTSDVKTLNENLTNTTTLQEMKNDKNTVTQNETPTPKVTFL